MAGLSSSNAPFDQNGFDMHTRDLERLWLLYSDVSAGTGTTVSTSQPVDLGSDLTAIQGLSGSGYLYRIQAGAWELRGSIPWTDLSGKPSTLAGYGITDAVPNTRTVSTTSPLAGGGALSGNLTLSLGTVPATLGGTGQTVYTVGDLLYASTTTALSRLADVATGNALISGGVGVAPSWGKIGLTTHISGTLAVGNGGTNITSYAVGDLLYASGTTTLAKLSAPAANGAILLGSTTAPSWLASVAAGQVLTSSGAGSNPAWSSTPTMGISGTTTGQITLAHLTAANSMTVVATGISMTKSSGSGSTYTHLRASTWTTTAGAPAYAGSVGDMHFVY